MLATAKIHILKQFTTSVDKRRVLGGLCLLLQRYTFWSNSQHLPLYINWYTDCACYCKDTHFEAIHNPCSWISCWWRLCLLLQRYTFWSNSQRLPFILIRISDCACYCKDTHFEAIHNFTCHYILIGTIVLATAKIHILKQFTTRAGVGSGFSELCLLLQRYTFWSNSQLLFLVLTLLFYCACYCKDTHFEAIHN